mmetsp:Transcript_23921/g.62372  ORF Transcript_23921/g.62372 Transcript_23921/m.62372 type:complete len:296 (-) Transcript_23921:77-964(-)
MENLAVVAVRDARDDLCVEGGAGLLIEAAALTEVRPQVTVQQFEHQEELVGGDVGVEQRHDVRMREVSEQRDLAQRRDRYSFLVVLESDPLQGEPFVRPPISDLIYRPDDAGADALEPLEPAHAGETGRRAPAAQLIPHCDTMGLDRVPDRLAVGLPHDLRGQLAQEMFPGCLVAAVVADGDGSAAPRALRGAAAAGAEFYQTFQAALERAPRGVAAWQLGELRRLVANRAGQLRRACRPRQASGPGGGQLALLRLLRARFVLVVAIHIQYLSPGHGCLVPRRGQLLGREGGAYL